MSSFILDDPAADDDAGGIWSTAADDEYMDGRRSFRLLVRTGQLVSARRARKRQRPRLSRWLAARRHGEHQRFNRQHLPLNEVRSGRWPYDSRQSDYADKFYDCYKPQWDQC